MGTISEEMYCSEQINVPLNLPYILKQYAKAAIKTQPRDLLHWSSAYFRALANGDVPPVKDRIEYPLISTPSGLTAGFLKILIKQFGKGGIIEEKDLINKWKGVGLELDELQNMLRLCGFRKTVRWLNFVAVAAGFLSPNLTQTMILICELLTDEPEGGSAAIVYQTFMTLYIYLARMDCGPICHLKSNMADTFSEEVSAEAEEGTTEKSSERLSEIEVALEREPTLDSNDSANGVIMVWEDVTHPDFVQERNSIKDPKTAEENVEDNAADIADIIPVDVVDEATTVVDEEEKADEQETVKSVESYDNTGITLTFHDEEQDVKIDDYTGPIEPKLKKRFEKKLEEEQEGKANERTDDEDKTIKNDEIKENDETKENDDKEEGGGGEEGEQVGEKKNEDEQGMGGGDEKEENKSDSKAGDEVEHKEEGEENENGEKVEGEDEIVEKEGDEEGKGDVREGEEGAEKETEEEVEKEIEGEMKKESEEETQKGIEEEVKKETEGEVEKEIEEEIKKETEEELKKEIEEEVKKESKEADKKEEKGEGEKTLKSRTKKRKKKQAKKEGEEGETKGEGEEEESDHEEQSRYEYSLELEEEEDEKLEEEKSVKEETVVITEEVEEVKEEEEEVKEEEEVAEEQVKEEQSIDLKITDSAVALQGQRKSDIQVYGCLHLPKHRRRSVTDSIVSEPDNHFWVHVPGIGPMVPEKQILSLKAYFLYCSEKQGGYVMPRNIKHHLCPSMEPPLEMEKRRSSEVEWINDAVHHDK